MTSIYQEEEFVYKLWAPRPLITTGGYDRDSGLKLAEETSQLIGYGALFIANVSRSVSPAVCYVYLNPFEARPPFPPSREPPPRHT